MLPKDNNTKRFLSAALVLSVLVFLLAGCGPQQFKTQMFQRNDASGWGPSGLAWNGRDLVLGDGTTIMDIHAIETGPFFAKDSNYNANGFFLFSRTPEPLSRPVKVCGLAWEGECCGKGFLWIADSLSKEIIKVNSKNEILKRLPSPGDAPNGLAFDGKDLWVADSIDSKIYKISPEDGTVLMEFNSPIKEPMGLAWDCSDSRLWIVGISACSNAAKDCYQTKLVKLNIQTGKVSHEVKMSDKITRPSGLEWVNGVLWVSDHNLNRVFKVAARGEEVLDPKVYTSPITVKPRKIIVQKMSPEEEAKLVKEDTRVKAEEAKAAAEEARTAAQSSKTSADEAKTAAKDAKTSADDAKTSAEKSEKAFEMQLKK